ncbi:hypothetical protein P3875_01280 [Myroides sp. JBRI-B21084]|uniref:hypothetical protein n=1 Tax=Myroides sp. JBRI-B21084 TaxID=3119977 RepID=UPI0026E48131|nr:hypothetical protein [Paenimyroides cloacae]WKW46733.1 hypothetical protein P3875_01280 [Paenimyroides cloacae]
MKYWTHFLEKKTPLLTRNGKKQNAILFEIEELQTKLKMYGDAYNENECEIMVKALIHNSKEQIEIAKEKALKYNESPINRI